MIKTIEDLARACAREWADEDPLTHPAGAGERDMPSHFPGLPAQGDWDALWEVVGGDEPTSDEIAEFSRAFWREIWNLSTEESAEDCG